MAEVDLATSPDIELQTRPQVAAAIRQVVRMMKADGLEAGSKLPPQAEICDRLGIYNNTLSAAMQAMVDSGLITRKRKAGTVVLDPHRVIQALWRVGIALFPATATEPYYGQLLFYLQSFLMRAGCSCWSYMQSAGWEFPGRPNPSMQTSFTDFFNLSEDLAKDRLDAVISPGAITAEDWAARRKKGLVMVHVGPWEETPCGVVIDQSAWVRDAIMLFHSRGLRRPAVISAQPIKSGCRRFWKSYTQTLHSLGLKYQPRLFWGGIGPVGGFSTARYLLSLAESERPDALIVIDDRVATGLTATLAEAGQYRPEIAVQTNMQSPLAYSLPIYQYDLDGEAMAQAAVNMVIEYLIDPNLPLRRDWVYPRMLDPKPRQVKPAEFQTMPDSPGISSVGVFLESEH